MPPASSKPQSFKQTNSYTSALPALIGCLLLLLAIVYFADVKMSQEVPYTTFSSVIHLKAGTINTGDIPKVDAKAMEHMHPDTPSLFLLTLEPINESVKSPIEKVLGTSLSEYVPENTFIIFATPTQIEQISAMSGVRWIGKMPTSHKIDPAIKDKTDELVVMLATPSSTHGHEMQSDDAKGGHNYATQAANRFQDELQSIAHGITAVAASRDRVVVKVPIVHAVVPDVSQWLAQQDNVKYVEAKPKYRLMEQATATTGLKPSEHAGFSDSRILH